MKPLIFTLLLLATQTSLFASLPDFTGLVKKNSPAVVNISTTQNHRSNNIYNQLDNSPLSELLKRLLENEGLQPNTKPYETHTRGSGFIISEDGYIITNHHVVDHVSEIIIKLNDQREFKGRVIGSDKNSDIALIKINASHLPFVKIGSSDQLKAGEWVLAIGSPFGYDSSVTAGIVSAKRRSIPGSNYIPFIQTDVAINPGNSGGPLFNLAGEVVGVNSQIYSKSGGYMGISFSVPIEMAMNVVNQLKKDGQVSRGWLGVMIQNVPKDLIDTFGLSRAKGALIGNVLANSPAEKAGLQRGDIILSYNGHAIENSATLPPFVGNTPIGKQARLKIMRNQKIKYLKVIIEALPKDNQTARNQKPTVESIIGNNLGLLVSPITRKLRHKYQLKSSEGVIVEQVLTNAAKKSGILKNDIILMIGNQAIRNQHDFEVQTKKLEKGKTVAILLLRQGQHQFIPFHVPK